MMTTPSLPSSSHVGRFTGLVLILVVCACVGLIGFSGYLKYQLDRSESLLYAPQSFVSTEQDIAEKMRRNLDYSGFLGFAQNYATTHDSATLNDMKIQLKSANDLLINLPENASHDVRQELQAILATYNNVMQKALRSSVEASAPFTINDLVPLYAALPVLNAQLDNATGTNRIEAHSHLQFWAMLLTLISWSSLIIAAAMSVGIYLALRDRASAPLRALAQSIKNMASGDMRTSIWGMERTDMVGELARAADLARYHFSQLPDISLLTEQGPLRLRFEGQTHSLFEGMMQSIAHDSEHVRNQATELTQAITQQQNAINSISSRVETILLNVEKHALEGDSGLKQILQSLSQSAQALRKAHLHSSDQLNRIVPHLQERAQGIADIAQITGKHIAQTLQSLTLTEHSLKASAAQSDQAIKKLSSSADDVSTRLFGAVNLLQASGKVLAETTEKTQSRMNEVLEKLDHNAQALSSSPVASGHPDASLPKDWRSPAMEEILQALQKTQQKLEDHFETQSHATQAHINLLSTQSSSLLSQTSTTAQTLSSASETLRNEQNRFKELIDHVEIQLSNVSSQLEEQAGRVSTDPSAPPTDEQLHSLSEKMAQLSDKILAMSNTSATTSQLAALPHQIISEMDKRLSAREPMLDAFSSKVLEDIKTSAHVTEQTVELLRHQFVQLSDAINSSAEAHWANAFQQRFNATAQLIEKIHTEINALKDVETDPSQKLVKEIEARWFQMAAQIEATRSDLAQAITQQVDRIEMRLSKDLAPTSSEPSVADNTQRQIEQQTQILTELVATLGVLDAHMQQLKSEMRVAQR